MTVRRCAFCLVVVLLAAIPAPALSESEFPSRPVRLVVPVSAGGAPDVLGRLLADRLSALWGQPVIVENRPGAGERIGAEAVAKAPGDGYTLLLSTPGPLVTSQFLYRDLPFDPAAFVPIGVLVTGHLVLLTRKDAPFDEVQDVVSFAKAHPGKLSYGSPGTGTSPHLTGEMFMAAAGIETTHVPYKGLAPALADLLAGRIDIMFDNLGNSLRLIREGRVKALAVASSARIEALPGLPALAQSYPGVVSNSWFALVAPPGTPPPLAGRISAAVGAVLREPQMTAKLRALSFTAVGSTPAQMASFVREETGRWRKVITAAHIRAD